MSILAGASLSPAGIQERVSLPTGDVAIRGEFEELFVVGAAAGDAHELLYGLVDIAFAPDGELYVLEERNHRVVAFAPDGAFRRFFAREGQGPGEFRLPMTLAVTADNQVAVWDFQNQAYLLFSRDGEYLRNVGWGDFLSAPSRGTVRRWPAGGVVYLPRQVHDEGDPIDEIDRGVILWEPLGDTGAPQELLEVHHPKRRGREVAGVFSLNSGPRFAPTARWDALPDGRLAVVDGVPYEVRIVDPDSGSTVVLSRDIAPRAVAEDDREWVRQQQRESFESPAGGATLGGGGGGGGGLTRARIGQLLEAIEFAELMPVIGEVRVDGSGRLWIQRQGPTPDAPGPIDVVSAAGEYIGTLPAMDMPHEFGPDGMVAWMEGGRDVEVERVIVRRVPPELR